MPQVQRPRSRYLPTGLGCTPRPEVSETGPSPATGFRLGYRPALDGIRGVSVLAIMAFHSPLWTFVPNGFLSLDLFFVLSGFLITALLAQEFQRTGTISLRHFYLRRALRLFPALYVLLAACCLYALFWAERGEARLLVKAVVLTFGYCANWYWYFPINMHLLGHTWTLSLEEQYYLL
jgi:peptidoglycan/LPS O-acetylase OafA/YrhL